MELSYLNVAIKLIMGLLSLVLVINISGKGNLRVLLVLVMMLRKTAVDRKSVV